MFAFINMTICTLNCVNNKYTENPPSNLSHFNCFASDPTFQYDFISSKNTAEQVFDETCEQYTFSDDYICLGNSTPIETSNVTLDKLVDEDEKMEDLDKTYNNSDGLNTEINSLASDEKMIEDTINFTSNETDSRNITFNRKKLKIIISKNKFDTKTSKNKFATKTSKNKFDTKTSKNKFATKTSKKKFDNEISKNKFDNEIETEKYENILLSKKKNFF